MEAAGQVSIPVRVINTDMWPTNSEGNKRHFKSFDATILPGMGHFLMQEEPYVFNNALDEIIQRDFL